MSVPSSGLFPALIGYYRRLQDDPESGVAEQGFKVEKVHFAILLEPDGSLAAFEDIRERSDKGKSIPRPMQTPDGGGRQGIGLKPFYCFDNTGYALGRDNKGKPARALEQFNAFRDFHLSFLPELEPDPGFLALTLFLKSWDPARAETLPNWEEAAGLNVVFRLRGRAEYVHQSTMVKETWLRRTQTPNASEAPVKGFSLIDGAEVELARLHPQIRGVVGANTTGAAIVSFNLNAFESYGKSQSYNAPVGVHDAFRYTTALNRLLADDSRRIRIGDATVTFWTDQPAAADFESFFADTFDDAPPSKDAPAEHAKTRDRLRSFLEAARRGSLSEVLSDPDAPFYVLGLAPNASRLNIRYWLVGTVAQFAGNLARYADELKICKLDRQDKKAGTANVDASERTQEEDAPPTIYRLLRETVREAKELPGNLAGEVTRAVLSGSRYPRSLFDSVLRRIRVAADVTPIKASILKAYLLREKLSPMDVYLNRVHPDPAYHCGRLFAVLEFAQENALQSTTSMIVRRNMRATMAAPGLMLGRLQSLAESAHIPKLRKNVGTFVKDELGAISNQLGDRPPSTLDFVRQGIFALGFYQERSYLALAKTAIRKEHFYRNNRGDWMASHLEVVVSHILIRAGIHYYYEPSFIPSTGPERRPDFLIRQTRDGIPIYFEVLGFQGDDYDQRWDAKVEAFRASGLTEEGGPAGRLVVLDWRGKWGEDKSQRRYPMDEEVLPLLDKYVSIAAPPEKSS